MIEQDGKHILGVSTVVVKQIDKMANSKLIFPFCHEYRKYFYSTRSAMGQREYLAVFKLIYCNCTNVPLLMPCSYDTWMRATNKIVI
jgi:hypothetical protein